MAEITELAKFENSKENFQPLKRGRNPASMAAIAKPMEEMDLAALEAKQNKEKRYYEKRLKNEQDSDDPLDLWIQYIRWCNRTYVTGGNEVISLLERCTKEFKNDDRYNNDDRYLRIWIDYANRCQDPEDIYKFLLANQIGLERSLFFVGYALALESKGNFKEASFVFEEGLNLGAEPVHLLKKHQQQYLARVVRRTKRMQEDDYDEDEEDQEFEQARRLGITDENQGSTRMAFSRIGAMSGGFQYGGIIPQQQQQQQQQQQGQDQQSNSNGFTIYDESSKASNPSFPSMSAMRSQVSAVGWKDIGSNDERSKENLGMAGRWTDSSMGGSALAGKPNSLVSNKPKFDIFVDDGPASGTVGRKQMNGSTVRAEPKVVKRKRSTKPHKKIEIKPKDGERWGFDASLVFVDDEEYCFEEIRMASMGYQDDDSFAADDDELDQQQEYLDDSSMFDDSSNNHALQDDNDGYNDVTVENLGTGDDPRVFQSTIKKLEFSVYQDNTDTPTAPVSAVSKIPKPSMIAKPSVPSFPRQNEYPEHDNRPPSPTINTKAALEDVMAMFNEPVGDEEESEGEEEAAGMSSTLFNSFANSTTGGFAIYNDDDDNDEDYVPKDTAATEEEIGNKGGFQIFEEATQELENKQSGFAVFEDVESNVNLSTADAMDENGMALQRHSSNTSGRFAIYQDDENAAPESEFPRDPIDNSEGLNYQTMTNQENLHGEQDREQRTIESEDQVLRSIPCTPLSARKGTLSVLADSLSTTAKKRTVADILKQDLAETVPPPSTGKLTNYDILMAEQAAESSSSSSSSSAITTTTTTSTTSSSANAGSVEDDINSMFTGSGEPIGFREQGLSPEEPMDDFDFGFGSSSSSQSSQDEETVEDIGGLSESLCVSMMGESGVEIDTEVHMCNNTAPAMDSNPILDPFDEEEMVQVLSHASPEIETYDGYMDFEADSIPDEKALSSLHGDNVMLGLGEFSILKSLGDGGEGQVFLVQDAEDLSSEKTTYAMKVQDGITGVWEFYIMRQLFSRINPIAHNRFVRADQLYVYKNRTYLMMEYCGGKSLQDLINAFKLTKKTMDEELVMFYAIEMLHLVELLQGAGIMHCDIKPDNLMLLDQQVEGLGKWHPNWQDGWQHKGLKMIDFGHGVDTQRYQSDVQFNGKLQTDNFACPEMQQGMPWKQHADLFGVASTVYTLLYGEYMEIELSDENRYKPVGKFKRYWHGELWTRFFDECLNSSSMTSVVQIKEMFIDFILSNERKATAIKIKFGKAMNLVKGK